MLLRMALFFLNYPVRISQKSCRATAEKDNVGCYYLKDGTFTLVPAEKITANKEFCDCEFAWRFAGGAHGVSLGKTLPAIPEEETTHYEKAAFTVENAAVIPCTQVLGAYQVTFER